MKLLLLGKNGQVGWELQRSLAPLGEVIALDRQSVNVDGNGLCGDVGDLQTLAQTIRSVRPDVIVNAAAHTAVDKAESEPDLALRLNAEAPEVMALEAKSLGALLVRRKIKGAPASLSTDAAAQNAQANEATTATDQAGAMQAVKAAQAAPLPDAVAQNAQANEATTATEQAGALEAADAANATKSEAAAADVATAAAPMDAESAADDAATAANAQANEATTVTEQAAAAHGWRDCRHRQAPTRPADPDPGQC